MLSDNTNIRVPLQGINYFSSRTEKLLLLCYYNPFEQSTAIETIAFIQRLSFYSITVLNLFEHRYDATCLALPPTFNLQAFDGIIIHNTVSYDVDNLNSLDHFLKNKISSFNGVKVLLKQDENIHYREIAAHIGKTGYDLVFTSLPEQEIPLVYPEQLVSKSKFVKMLTGYITPNLRELHHDHKTRPIDSDIILPGKHFVELNKDCSNLDLVIELLSDENKRNEITDPAYEEIIQNPKYWIETFVIDFDNHISDLFEFKVTKNKPILGSLKKATNVLLLVEHEPIKDPRLAWIAQQGITHDINIIQAGISQNNECVLVMKNESNDSITNYPQVKWTKGIFTKYFNKIKTKPAGLAAFQELLFLEYIFELPEEQLCTMLGAPYKNRQNNSFRSLLVYVLNISTALLTQTSHINGLHAIIAVDLPTLAAALILKSIFDVPLLYDAHEYWPEAHIKSYEYEIQFWNGLEQRLVAHADYCQTVSTGLAKLMSQQYNKHFETVPNCISISEIPSNQSKIKKNVDECRFVFQGLYGYQRGLELLINAWPYTDKRAILIFRGPDGSSYQNDLIKLAEQTGLLGTRILFLPAVKENELISALSDADVGLLPYVPYGNNHLFCCPNKLSQYMAAKLPILANNTQFVKSIIEDADAGIVTDFNQPQNIVDAVAIFLNDKNKLDTMGNNAYNYLINNFNWEKVSQPFYKAIRQLTDGKKPSYFSMHASNINTSIYTERSKKILNIYNDIIINELKTNGKNSKTRKLAIYIWRYLLPEKLKNLFRNTILGTSTK